MYNMDYKYVIIGRFNEKRSQFPGVCTWGGEGGDCALQHIVWQLIYA